MNLTELNNNIKGLPPEKSLKYLASAFPGKIVFTTSFGAEDQAITHIILDNYIPIKITTLDTGRLFPETYRVFNETIKRYNTKISVFFPDHEAVEQMVNDKGPFSFYYSKENRTECCRIRKVMPLNRALKGMECWISGLRADQSPGRSALRQLEYDEISGMVKYYPIFDWTFDQVMKFIKGNSIPYNVLHDRGFVSIGCEPCTRAIKEGEDFRSGRWWWESGSEKECGLHAR